jgi:zinc D-Ala-D-Ala carboxypeptidase
MHSRTTFRRRRFVAIGLTVMLLAGVGLATKYAVDVAAGTVAPPLSGGGWTGGSTGGGLTAADGLIGEGDRVSVFDTELPAVANLDPALLEAVQRAADAAAADDVEFYVTSGWRSPEMQAKLLEDAVRLYASEEEAARWVASPETSQHVSGDAIDIGPFDATYWLSLNGAQYGLCQIYANESWHFELRPDAVTQGCPEQYLDPTHDPRTQG